MNDESKVNALMSALQAAQAQVVALRNQLDLSQRREAASLIGMQQAQIELEGLKSQLTASKSALH